MEKPNFWRYFWLNCRYFIAGTNILGALFSAYWTYDDGHLNLIPLAALGGGATVLMLIGTIFEYRKYLKNLK